MFRPKTIVDTYHHFDAKRRIAVVSVVYSAPWWQRVLSKWSWVDDTILKEFWGFVPRDEATPVTWVEGLDSLRDKRYATKVLASNADASLCSAITYASMASWRSFENQPDESTAPRVARLHTRAV